MAKKQSCLFLLLVLFLVFSLVLAGEKQQEKSAAAKVDQLGRGGFGGGGGFGGRRPCFRCGFRGKQCCGFRCCTDEEYKEYIKAQGLPHN